MIFDGWECVACKKPFEVNEGVCYCGGKIKKKIIKTSKRIGIKLFMSEETK